MHGRLSLAMSALVLAAVCFLAPLVAPLAARAEGAQQPNPLFVQAQQLAAQIASSAQPGDVKAGFAQRFDALASQQRQLWQMAGSVDAGQCIDACLDEYNNEVMSWQTALQQFNADAGALAPQGDAQATMENHTGDVLDFYIDDQYQCRALMNLICTAQTKSGTHVFAAKRGDAAVKTEEATLMAGESRTWVVP